LAKATESPIEASDSVASWPRTISMIQRLPSRRSTSAKMLAESIRRISSTLVMRR
jgi:hypothetical protein